MTDNQKYIIGQMPKQIKREYARTAKLDLVDGMAVFVDEDSNLVHEIDLGSKVDEWRWRPSDDESGMNQWKLVESREAEYS